MRTITKGKMSTLKQILATTTKTLTRHTLTRHYGDTYNEVFEQQMIITDAFFSHCAKYLGSQIKNCHNIHLHWSRENLCVVCTLL